MQKYKIYSDGSYSSSLQKMGVAGAIYLNNELEYRLQTGVCKKPDITDLKDRALRLIRVKLVLFS